jgi:hypothetical protein
LDFGRIVKIVDFPSVLGAVIIRARTNRIADALKVIRPGDRARIEESQTVFMVGRGSAALVAALADIEAIAVDVPLRWIVALRDPMLSLHQTPTFDPNLREVGLMEQTESARKPELPTKTLSER